MNIKKTENNNKKLETFLLQKNLYLQVEKEAP